VRALKILVIVMGVLLIGGAAILIAAIAARMSQTRSAPSPFVAPPVDLPAGARIESIGVGPDRVVIDMVLPGGNRQLVILDLATGRRLGVVPLPAAP